MPIKFDFYKGKKVLVTGHTGFIGSWLTKWLTMLKADVCGYSLEPPTQPNIYDTLNLGSEILDVRGDIRNTNLLQKAVQNFCPEIVFHLAAQPIVLESYDDPVETFDINVTGTVNLLNELRKIDSVKTIVVVTSDKSYQNNEMSIRSIAKEMGISRNSVRKYLKNKPMKKHKKKRGSKLDPYRDTVKALIEKNNLSAVRIMEVT